MENEKAQNLVKTAKMENTFGKVQQAPTQARIS